MPKTARKYTLVTQNQGALDYETFVDAEQLKVALAKLPETDEAPLVFASEPVTFTISRTPVVQLGSVKERKKRGPKLKMGNTSKPKNGNIEHADRT